MRTVIGRAVAVAALAPLAACGRSSNKQASTVPSEQRAILATIDQLQAASRGGDARKICARATAVVREQNGNTSTLSLVKYAVLER
jgi:hypothetical protein